MAETKTTKKTETAAKAEPKKVAPKTSTAKTAKTAKTTAPKAAAKTEKTTTAKKTATKKAPVKTAEVKVEEKVEVKVAEAKEPAKKASVPMLKIKLVKSASGRLEKQQRTLVALGLHKIGSESVKPDNAQTRGMIFVVKHLVTVESVKEN